MHRDYSTQFFVNHNCNTLLLVSYIAISSKS